MDSLAIIHDGRCTTTEGIPIRLRTHHICKIVMLVSTLSDLWATKKRRERTVSKGEEVFGVRIIGPATSTQSPSVEGNVGGGTSASNFTA